MNQNKGNGQKQRADQLLLARGFFDSRAKAQAAIEAGLVSADGVIVRKASQEIPVRARLEAEAVHPYVSRGGIKLAHAMQYFGISAKDKICLDVGASTGGFCDVLLRDGATKIYAIDTGHDQFHASMRGRKQIVLMEGFDVRNLAPGDIPEPVQLVTIDVSFISLALVLPSALAVCDRRADLIALIKPQFEVGKANIGKGGIVKDETLYEGVFERIRTRLQDLRWQTREIIPSPVTGGDGNREFLIAATKGS